MSTPREMHNPKLDKTAWGNGPWAQEPDKIQWIDPTTDLDCLMVRNSLGAWCGYVGLPPEHPLHGKDYNDVAADVHGGLTFSEACRESEDGFGICHIPEPGRTPHLWWFGFDCSHLGDKAPGIHSYYNSDGIYRQRSYVEAQVAALALQLKQQGGIHGAAG